MSNAGSTFTWLWWIWISRDTCRSQIWHRKDITTTVCTKMIEVEVVMGHYQDIVCGSQSVNAVTVVRDPFLGWQTMSFCVHVDTRMEHGLFIYLRGRGGCVIYCWPNDLLRPFRGRFDGRFAWVEDTRGKIWASGWIAFHYSPTRNYVAKLILAEVALGVLFVVFGAKCIWSD